MLLKKGKKDSRNPELNLLQIRKELIEVASFKAKTSQLVEKILHVHFIFSFPLAFLFFQLKAADCIIKALRPV